MPGIVCIAGNAKGNLLDRMCNIITQKERYKVDKYYHDNFCVGRVHLGLLNPEPQPIYNEDKSLCIFMDGEIFDYEKEKETLKQKGHQFYINNEPEFCLHLYEEYGKKFVEKLNGSFVIVVIDIKNQKLLIANDRYGLRPLYYAKIGDKLLLASEVKAILKDETFKKEINDEAVAEFFTFGQLLGRKTFFKGIEIIPPASILEWGNGDISIEQYWEFKYDENIREHSDKYYVDGLIKLFKQAVKRRMKGNYKIGLGLSGGMDSRAVLAAINSPVTTITFSFPNIDNTPKFAKKAAEIKGFSHKLLKIKEDFLINYAKEAVFFTEGMIPLNYFLDIKLWAKEYCDILIGGWEPETTFKGEFLNKKILLVENDEELCKLLYDKYSIINDKTASLFFSDKYYKYISFQNLKKEIEKIKNKHPANKNDIFIFLNRELRSMVMGFVYQRNVIEDRQPFRDNDLIDFALKIPPELRYNYRIYFKFLKKLSPELFDISDSSTNIKIGVPYFLHKIFSLKKKAMRKIRDIVRIKSRGLIKIPFKSGHPEYGERIRVDKGLKKWVEDILLDERTLNRKYFNRNFIFRMVKDHMNYKSDYTSLIFLLLTFELWYRIFIEGEGQEYEYSNNSKGKSNESKYQSD